MGVVSCRIIFLLSDVVFSRVCCLVSFRILLHELNSDLWLCVPRGFDPRCGLAQPNPTRPGPAQLGPRAPDALPLPMPRPPPLVSFPSFNSPAHNSLSLPLLSLPRGALGFGDADRRNLDPRGEPPPLSLPFLFVLLSPTPRASSAAPRAAPWSRPSRASSAAPRACLLAAPPRPPWPRPALPPWSCPRALLAAPPRAFSVAPLAVPRRPRRPPRPCLCGCVPRRPQAPLARDCVA
jgi:hypothetical protein